MSDASKRANISADSSRIDRLQPWIAALGSALLHLLVLLVAILSPTPPGRAGIAAVPMWKEASLSSSSRGPGRLNSSA